MHREMPGTAGAHGVPELRYRRGTGGNEIRNRRVQEGVPDTCSKAYGHVVLSLVTTAGNLNAAHTNRGHPNRHTCDLVQVDALQQATVAAGLPKAMPEIMLDPLPAHLQHEQLFTEYDGSEAPLLPPPARCPRTPLCSMQTAFRH